MKYILFSVCLLAFAGSSMAQTDLSRIKLQVPVANTDSLIRLGIDLQEEKKYEEAIAEYEKVNENDSNYVLAQFKVATAYVLLKKHEEAIALADRIARNDKSYYVKTLILKGNAYDGMKNYQASEDLYRKGMSEFPNSPKFYHEMAISYYNQKRYKEAYTEFIKAIHINPQYSPSHYYLAILSLKQKEVVQAMLGFQYYLLLDNSTSRARNVIKLLEQIGDDAINYEEIETTEPFAHDEHFDDLEAIIKSKAAYSEKFKLKVKMNYRMLKQMQVVADEVKYDPNDQNFHNQFYARFFSELSSKKHTETYLYYSVSGMEVAEAKKWIKGNQDKVDKFGNWFTEYSRYTFPVDMPENPGRPCYKIYSNIDISGMGPFDSKETRTGYWKYFFPSSMLRSEGSFDSQGQKTGPWKYYYENGNLKESCSFKNGEIDGDYYKYYPNGHLMNHLIYANGKFEGKQSLYHSNGNLKNTYTYKNGIMDGEEMGFFTTGKKEYQSMVTGGNYSGPYNTFFENGHPSKSFMIVKGVRTGPSKEFFNYPQGAIYAEGNFENNNQTGDWKYYFDTGKLYRTGAFNKNGMKNDLWKTFNEQGVVVSEERYADGRNEGESKNYYDDGKVYEEFFYRKNKVNLYKYYNTSGKLVKEIAKQKNDFYFELYNPNGTLRLTGKLLGEQFDGTVTDYNHIGIKTKSTEYKNEQRINKQLTYHPNGKIQSETPFMNGLENGLFTQYFADGTPVAQGYYVNGATEGYWYYYEKTGTLSEIRFYRGNERTGWQRTFACNGKLFRMERLEDGHVAERYYYDTLSNVIKYIDYNTCNDCDVSIPSVEGGTWIKRHLKNNYIHGLSLTYYPDGKTEDELTYDMDLLNGVAKSYDALGKVYSETTYDFDLKNGPYTLYKNGKLDYTATYHNNQLHGEAKDYYESGKLFQTTNYRYNDCDGPTTMYDESGAVAVVLNYEDDHLVSYTYENESGKLVEALRIDKPDMVVKAYYRNKKPSLSFTLKNGEKEGAYTMYASTGQKLMEAQYTDGYLNGLRTEYFANGKVKNKCTFRYGDSHGLYTEYNENGSLRAEFNYVSGTRHGLSKYYDGNGKLMLQYFFYDGNAVKIIR